MIVLHMKREPLMCLSLRLFRLKHFWKFISSHDSLLHIRMKERPWIRLLLVMSNSGWFFQAFPGLAVYTATKFFVEALTQSLRLETVGSGVKVTSIQPGRRIARLFVACRTGGVAEQSAKSVERDKFGLVLCSVKRGLFYRLDYLIPKWSENCLTFFLSYRWCFHRLWDRKYRYRGLLIFMVD